MRNKMIAYKKRKDADMVLKNINVSQFRNYSNLDLTLKNGINIIYGDNAQGKTNLLESIYVLALTKSHRSFIDNSLIKAGEKSAKIKGTVIENNVPFQLEIVINSKNKKIKIDQNEIKRVSDYINKMNIIIFYPEDLELIKSSPGIRRRFLNLELSQIDGQYLNLYGEFSKILKMRNDYLKKINKGLPIDMGYFEILNDYFIEKAVEIYQRRAHYINLINERCGKIFSELSGLSGLHLQYKTTIPIENQSSLFLQEQLREKLNKMKEAEIRLGVTFCGPHRDDFEFYIDSQNIKFFGSQGQQRMAILALKLSEIDIFKEETKKSPILLLDDVFSELDDTKKNNLLGYIKQDIQTIITTTDLKNIDETILKHAKLIQIQNGQVIDIKEEE